VLSGPERAIHGEGKGMRRRRREGGEWEGKG